MGFFFIQFNKHNCRFVIIHSVKGIGKYFLEKIHESCVDNQELSPKLL